MAEGAAAHRQNPATDLPVDWEAVPLRDVAACRGGYGFPPKEQGLATGEIPFFKVSDMNRVGNARIMASANNYIDAATLNRLKAKVFAPGTVIFPKIGAAIGTNKKRLLISPSLIDNNVMGIWPTADDRLISEYLYYWLLAFDLRKLSAPGPLPSITQHSVLSTVIALPPIEEQQVIAGVLGAIERAREATEKVVVASRELKRSIRRHLFTNGPIPVTQAEDADQQDTKIGKLPKHWKVVRFLDVLSEPLKNGHSAREVSSGQGVRTLTLSAVTYDDFSLANTKVTSADPDRVKGLWLQEDDILIERANTRELVGTAALYRGPKDFAIYPDLVIRARVRRSTIKSKYAIEFLRTAGARKYFQSNARGAAGNMPKIGHGIVEELPLPLPPIDEQATIAEILDALDRKYESEAGRAVALKQLFASLLRDLATGRRRVDVLEAPHG